MRLKIDYTSYCQTYVTPFDHLVGPDPNPESSLHLFSMVLIVEVSVAYRGEADKGVIHAVQVCPVTLYVVKDGGWHKDEDGDEGGKAEPIQ